MTKISIIIPTLNKCQELSETLESIRNQTYKNVEVVVIDGGSRDGTVNLLKKSNAAVSSWLSEPDNGISDAFNKGVRLSTGDYLYFLGAGDYLWDNNVLTKMMQGIDPMKDILVCGRINRIPEKGNRVLYTSTLNFKKWHLLYKMSLPHQGLFMGKKYFDKYGLFDMHLKYSMDYDLLLRSYKNFPEVVLKDVMVAAWREGGVGKDRTLEIFDEYKMIRIKNKIAPKMLIDFIDILSRLKYHACIIKK